MISALGSESDDPGPSPGRGKALCPWDVREKKMQAPLLGLAKSIYCLVRTALRGGSKLLSTAFLLTNNLLEKPGKLNLNMRCNWNLSVSYYYINLADLANTCIVIFLPMIEGITNEENADLGSLLWYSLAGHGFLFGALCFPLLWCLEITLSRIWR